jgi:hypothetical protein
MKEDIECRVVQTVGIYYWVAVCWSLEYALRHGWWNMRPSGTGLCYRGRSIDVGWQGDAAMLRRSGPQARGVPWAGIGRGLCGHQRHLAGACEKRARVGVG